MRLGVQQVLQVHLVGRQGTVLRQEAFHRAVGQLEDLGVDEGDARLQPGLQRVHARLLGLVLRVGAVLRVAQMGEHAHAHQALLQPLHRVQARQQRGGTFAQPALVRLHLGARGVQRFELGLPLRGGGEQVVQVPRQFDRNVGPY